MFPGLGGLSPKKMQAMMKQLGMSQEEIEALKVTIEKSDGTALVFQNPNVTKMNIQGNEMFQITGDFHEESGGQQASEEDIKTIMEKTNASEEEAKAALEDSNGELAEAILKLS